MLRKLILLPCLLLAPLWAQSSAPHTVSDFLHHPQKGEPYEFWSYQFTFDNGTEAWLTFSRLQVPAIGQKVAAELSFHSFRGKNRSVGKQFPTDQWTEDRKNATISIRTDYFMKGLPGNGHHVRFATGKNEGYFLDLQFNSELATFIPKAQQSKEMPLSLAVQIPRSQVSGRIAIGKDTLHVQGQGTLIQSWHPRRLTDFAQQTITLSCPYGDGYTGSLVQGKNGTLAGHVIRIHRGNTSLLYPQRMVKNGSVIRIEWQAPQEPALVIDLSTTQQKYSVLSTVDSWMERQAAKVALGGDQMLLRGQNRTATGVQKWVVAGF